MDSEGRSVRGSGLLVGRVRWFAAEFIIIIAGILTALAIDEWRENIDNERVEQEYLVQLVADLRETEQRIEQSDSRNAQVEKAAEQLVAAFETDGTADPDHLDEMLVEILPFTVPAPVLGTIEALVSTGDLRLIGDLPTKAAITRYLAHSRDLVEALNGSGRYHTDRVDHLRHLAMSHGITPGEVDIPSPGNPERHTNAGVSAFLQDSQAYAYAADVYREKRFMTMLRRNIASSAAELRQTLEPFIAPE